MIVKLKYTPMALILISLNGCASIVDKSMSPPSDTHWVNVEIKNPSPYTAPFPLEVVYISHKCLKEYVSGFDGKQEKEPSYNPITIPLEQQGNSDIWRAKVAMNGGGSCQWSLSEFDIGIEYTDVTHLGKKLVPGPAIGATIAFDDIASRNGQFKVVNDNLTLSPQYYPLIKRWSERKESARSDDVTLFGSSKTFSNYKIKFKTGDDIVVKYQPRINEKKFVEMKLPYERSTNAMIKFIYPNGEVVQTKSIHPDFDKVDVSR